MRRDDFFACGLEVDLLPGGEAGHTLLLSAGHDDQAIEALRPPGFENQRGLNDGDCVRILPAHLLHPFILAANDDGMHDAVEFFDPRRALTLTERCAGPNATSASLERFTLRSGLRISRPKWRTTSL